MQCLLNAEPFTWQTPKPFTRPHKEELLLWPGTGSSVELQVLSHRAWEPFLAQLSISILLTQNGYQTVEGGPFLPGKGTVLKTTGSVCCSSPQRPHSYCEGICRTGGELCNKTLTFLSLGLEEGEELSNQSLKECCWSEHA